MLTPLCCTEYELAFLMLIRIWLPRRAVVNWMLQPDTKGEKGSLSQMVRTSSSS